MSVEANPAVEEMDEIPSTPLVKATMEPEKSSGLEKPSTEASDLALTDDEAPVEPENPFSEQDKVLANDKAQVEPENAVAEEDKALADEDSLDFLEDPPIEPLPVKLMVPLAEPSVSYNVELGGLLHSEPNNDLMSILPGESPNELNNQEMPSTSATASDDSSTSDPLGSIYNPIVLD